MKILLLSFLYSLYSLCVFAQGGASTGLDFEQRINGKEIHKVMESLRTSLQKSSAVIYQQRDPIAYGTIVSPEGLIITKASEIENKDNLSIRIESQKYDQFQVLATNTDYDLALIKIDAKNLSALEHDKEAQSVGSVVISNGATTRSQRRMLVGIISAKSRPIVNPVRDYAYMGIEFSAPAVIQSIEPKSPAAIAGLKANDVIIAIDEAPLKNFQLSMTKLLLEKKPGESVNFKVKRGDQELSFTLTFVSALKFLGPDKMPKTRNDEMSGRTSKRAYPFPMVLQHDTPIPPHYMGGPLINLEGKIIGINIARANRCESYAIPIENALQIMLPTKDK